MVPYNSSAQVADFTETLLPGAFAGVVDGDTVLTVAHDLGGAYVIARTTSHTLALRDSALGLRFETQLGDSPLHQSVAEQVRRGDLQVSFGMIVGEDRWRREGGRLHRDIVSIRRLVDCSLVGFGAYVAATVTVSGASTKSRPSVPRSHTLAPGAPLVMRGTRVGGQWRMRDDEHMPVSIARKRLQLLERRGR
ncbi:MAG: HK97 family phage prohead protease [Actinomycetota bacterium]